MATTSYIWSNPVTFDINDGAPADVALPAIAGQGTRYLAAWTSTTADTGIAGRLLDGFMPAPTNEFAVSTPAPLLQFDPSVAALADGRYVVTYTDTQNDPGGDVRARLIAVDGTPGASFNVVTTSSNDDQAKVAALADGGFAVSWTRHLGAGNNDIVVNVYNADLTVRSPLLGVSTSPNNASHSSIAALAGGGFIVVWEESPAAGGDTEVRFSRFNAAGQPVGLQNVVIDTVGSINRDIQVKGLPDGGFVVAYEDDQWGAGSDITARVYNADGTARTNLLRVNDAAAAGDQVAPTLAVLLNGSFVVGWLSEPTATLYLRGYDHLGNATLPLATLADNATAAEFAAVGDQLITVWVDLDGKTVMNHQLAPARSITGTGGGDNLLGHNDLIREVFLGGDGDDVLEGGNGRDRLDGGGGRDTASYSMASSGVVARLFGSQNNTGDAAGDSYNVIENLTGSQFDDILGGHSGANVLAGGDGNDTITGREGNDTIIGGPGDDTATFAGNLGSYSVQDFGAKLLVRGPDGRDTLTSIEHVEFADATLTPFDDGNPLFDTLYYFSRNTDVYFAGVNALDHFNTFGRHEGRDPNGFFDTSGYLAVNKDVAVSGQNPLEHYHQSGWQEGRDPSIWFDTTLYLLRNPDVAAAGVDPLAHFLQFGFSEGRAAPAAVGPVVGGFDPQHYLLQNPDVAAAGVDPLAHFDAFGWHEGRNPNGWFDTAGYLAHYADVAAAGVNPLEHYLQFGWTEGRDPSARFDTLGYLAANPDVAAAGIDPLQHYLQFGIYEGRQAVNDGMWH